MLACPAESIKERIKSPEQIPGCRANQKGLDKRECEDFEMALKHKSKLHVIEG